MARCGDVARTLALANRLTDPHQKATLIGPLADAAMQQGTLGATLCPCRCKRNSTSSSRRFARSKRGQDDAARGHLGAIGLRSPFLEWKLFLRGLQAYYQKEDERASDNWQRLDHNRVPFRLAAPSARAIDRTYQAAQPAATQTMLQKEYEQLQGSTATSALQGLRATLSNPEQSIRAYRSLETIVPNLRQHAPQNHGPAGTLALLVAPPHGSR